MKVVIYAKWLKGQWQWRWTLHVRVDEAYIAGETTSSGDTLDPPAIGSLQLEPALSIGQASSLCSELQLQQRRNPLFNSHANPLVYSYANPRANLTKRNTSEPSEILIRLLTFVRETSLRIGIPQAIVNRMQLLNTSPISNSNLISNPKSTPPELRFCEKEYAAFVHSLQGRSLLYDELLSLLKERGLVEALSRVDSYLQLASLRGHVELMNGHEAIGKRTGWLRLLGLAPKSVWRCRRCGSEGRSGADIGISARVPNKGSLVSAGCAHCETDCLYCEACLTIGRTRYCSLLVVGRGFGEFEGGGKGAVAVIDEDVDKTLASYIAPWGLTDAQAEASKAGLGFINKPCDGVSERGSPAFLIWAVTGAGKTEMLFPLIAHRLKLGGKVLLAAPRKDVVIELNPRIIRAFPGYTVAALYGGSEDRWQVADITIATTHQLIRFQGKFDLVIMDEMDAFPYHNNPMLQFAAHKSRRSSGHIVLVSATPPPEFQKEARRKRLAYATVPARYHRHPLPVPQRITSPNVKQIVVRQSLPNSLRRHLQASLDRGAQIFLFVPHIKVVSQIVTLLQQEIALQLSGTLNIQGTSSKDPYRTDKVEQFRKGTIHVLVTTTILERGITVPKTDVFVLDAHASLFDEAALVQMSGRAGRSQSDPRGLVYFFSNEWTASQKDAIRHIRHMNTLARKRGLLI